MIRASRRELGLSAVRVVGVCLCSVLLYAWLPFTRREWLGWELIVGLAALTALLVWEVRVIVRSDHPVLRGVEAILIVAPLLLLLFASVYVRLSLSDPQAFTEPLSRLDGAYFAVTVFTTVGFGDISPVSEAARSMALAQMVADLAVVAFVVRVLVGAVRQRQGVLDGRG